MGQTAYTIIYACVFVNTIQKDLDIEDIPPLQHYYVLEANKLILS